MLEAQQGSQGREKRSHGGSFRVKELVRTNDAVVLSAIEALLTAADISVFVADQHISALEGAIGAFPRRLMVPDDEADAARALLREAGFGDELRAGT